MKNKIFFFFLLLQASSCSDRGKASLSSALRSAGSNRQELQKVLDRYSRPADSLKLRAAKFLITNMPYHHGYYGNEIKKYGKIFSIIDSLLYRKEVVTVQDRMLIGDSLLNVYGPPQGQLAEKIPDMKIMTGNYLITNIDFAFKAWKTAPWSKKVSFEDFCEYILPYRVRDEQIQQWRPAFYYQYTAMARNYKHADTPRIIFNSMNWDLGYETNFTVYFSKYFPFPQSLSDVIKGKVGGCETTTFFSATAMRAAGLPVAMDFIPHWGNTNNRHYMTRLVDHSGNRVLLTNQNMAGKTWHLVDFSTEFDEHRHVFTPNDMPEGLYVQYVRTIPKVYRYTFSQSPELTEVKETASPGELSPELSSMPFKDVTREYILCSSYTLRMSPELKKFKLAYLCVFDILGLKPVAVSRIERDTAAFHDIGRNIVYQPAVFGDSEFKPAGDPFYIDSTDRVVILKKEGNKKQDLRILRKTALYSYTAYHAEILKGGRFEGCDQPGFQHPVLLDSIGKYPFYMNEITIRYPKHYRYLRYIAPVTNIQEPDNIAELQFYETGSTVRLKGQLIGSEGSPGHEIAMAFDNDINTYYENKAYKNGWIGIDLGKNSHARVSRIRFCPRNDTNCILPENQYELFYWDGQWMSLGIQRANGYSLTYKDAPTGVLFWLRCRSGGNEERCFTYEGGRQKWW